MATTDDLPRYRDLMLPVLRAIMTLGGSGSNREISDQVVRDQGFSEELLALAYPTNGNSVLMDRLDWARSYCKLGGILESPKRALFLATEEGIRVAGLSDAEAEQELVELDRQVRRRRNTPKSSKIAAPDTDSEERVGDENDESWRGELLERLHQLSPDAFERFVLYLLRAYGMELERRGGSGDEGVDGLGTAPMTAVLTTTVAVQAKRYEPGRTVGREVVALFQADAIAVGAEHGVLVTTAKFSEPARKAALGRTPTIDLVDGDRLCDLCIEKEVGIRTEPVVQGNWFHRFETG